MHFRLGFSMDTTKYAFRGLVTRLDHGRAPLKFCGEYVQEPPTFCTDEFWFARVSGHTADEEVVSVSLK